MLKIDDKKFSKSRGNVIWVKDDYLDRGLHPDLLRYYLASYTAHNKEVNFAWNIFADKVNSELVGAFGNFLNRALTFSVKNFEGEVPEGKIDADVLARIEKTLAEVTSSLEEYEFKKAADSVMTLADYGNTYFQSHEPWKLIRSNKEEAGSVLKSCLQIAKAMIILMEPVMPAKMQEAWRQLGMPGEVKERAFSDAIAPLASGQRLGTPEILFDRLEEKFVKDLESIFRERIKEAESREREKTEGKKGEAKKGEISFEDFQSMDIRIGEIKSAEAIKGSNKLLKLKVDIGGEVRQVVAGIAQSYSMDDLVGTQVVVLANLQPAKLFGIESQAMLLAADVAGRAVLLRPREAVETGTKVR